MTEKLAHVKYILKSVLDFLETVNTITSIKKQQVGSDKVKFQEVYKLKFVHEAVGTVALDVHRQVFLVFTLA